MFDIYVAEISPRSCASEIISLVYLLPNVISP